MAKYKKEIADNLNVEFIHVSLDRDKDSALEWAKKEIFPWLHVLSDKSSKAKLAKYHTSGSVPFYCLVDKDGNVVTKGYQSSFAKAKEFAK